MNNCYVIKVTFHVISIHMTIRTIHSATTDVCLWNPEAGFRGLPVFRAPIESGTSRCRQTETHGKAAVRVSVTANHCTGRRQFLPLVTKSRVLTTLLRKYLASFYSTHIPFGHLPLNGRVSQLSVRSGAIEPSSYVKLVIS